MSETESRLRLPEGFTFGIGSSALQTEGALGFQGRSASVWETFAAMPGAIVDGSLPDRASDSYRRTTDDVALLKKLGVDSYRFSLPWPRLIPGGRGAVNAEALSHYDRFLDELLAAGIKPMATLHYYDLPQVLEDDGGWLNRSTVDAFAEYAAVVGEKFADRVTHWVPVNSPNSVALRGYAIGQHAPGKRLGFDVLAVAHHLLLAHGRGVRELRAAGAASIGCSTVHSPIWPASDDPADVGATKLFDAMWNGMWLEPMLLGRYPTDLAEAMGDLIHDGDMATIRQPLDFYGVNYYSPMRIGVSEGTDAFPFSLVPLIGHPRTASGWSVVPHALRDWLITLRARFRAALPPLMITESGSAWHDGPGPDGSIADIERAEYLSAHLDAVAEACERGVDIRAFYAWSLLDSWEWEAGYKARYGLVSVDPETGDRTPKKSFEEYAARISANR